MITVACVYWVDPLRPHFPICPPSWITKLQRMVDDNLLMPHKFVCLSNVEVPCERIPLKHNWRGWWSKIEIFRPGLFEDEILYIDLDTVILDSIGDMFYHGKDFVGLRPFNPINAVRQNYFASGMMSWKNDSEYQMSFIYECFDYEKHTRMFPGDQDYISARLQSHDVHNTAYWQDIVGGIYSYKRHIKNGKVCPDKARVVCFHGEPRPHMLNEEWLVGL